MSAKGRDFACVDTFALPEESASLLVGASVVLLRREALTRACRVARRAEVARDRYRHRDVPGAIESEYRRALEAVLDAAEVVNGIGEEEET